MAYLGENIAKLGFGLMRLPMNGDLIDATTTMEMVDLFLDSGFTYFDTAYVYIGGKSEEIVKTAIVDRYPRESFQLATKLTAWVEAKTAEDAKQMFWTSLKRTGAEYFDYYLLHNVGSARIKKFDDFGIWDYVLDLKEKGLVRHAGFSFHDKADVLDEMLTKHPEMEFVQLQLNYADWESATVQSRECYEVARKHNKPIIIMEPVKGGLLADLLPTEVKDVFDTFGSGSSYASWALRYAASLDGIITVLSGMSTIDQVRDNVSFMKDFQPLDNSERAVVEKAMSVLESIPSVPCTSCDYCRPGCPKNINIPGIIEAANRERVYKSHERAKVGYYWETLFSGKGSECSTCGKCEEACPQDIKIMDIIKEAAAKYES